MVINNGEVIANRYVHRQLSLRRHKYYCPTYSRASRQRQIMKGKYIMSSISGKKNVQVINNKTLEKKMKYRYGDLSEINASINSEMKMNNQSSSMPLEQDKTCKTCGAPIQQVGPNGFRVGYNQDGDA